MSGGSAHRRVGPWLRLVEPVRQRFPHVRAPKERRTRPLRRAATRPSSGRPYTLGRSRTTLGPIHPRRAPLETLADWIQRRGPLPPNEAVGWIIRLAKHVEALHEHGVAHGNVSPACVLLTSADPRTPGFMSDVRRTTESLPYHSPERMRGGQISPSDDVWAVAATLYTALTAAPPFVGASVVELKQQVLKGSPAPLSVYGVDDERLERLMGMSFAADAGRRLSNVALFRRELERVHPAPAGLEALEDEEVGDEDQAATAMLPLGKGADSAGSASMKALFAPPSFQADSATALGRSGARALAARTRRSRAPATSTRTRRHPPREMQL
ncbi:MAG: hypothetical protein U0414_38660 [Polyangiaceae bacterium]